MSNLAELKPPKEEASLPLQTALEALPRSRFVEPASDDEVCGHSIPSRQWIEHVIGLLKPLPQDRVLQIGTGSGYTAAILSQLVAELVTIETDPVLASAAEMRFSELELDNIELRRGDGTNGAKELAPFNKIFVTTPRLHKYGALLRQLDSSGVLFAIEQDEHHNQLLASYHYTPQGKLTRNELGPLPSHCELGKALLNLDYLDEALLEKCIALAQEEHKPVIEIVRRLVQVDENELYRGLAAESGLDFQPLETLIKDADPEFFGKFSRTFLDLLHIIPLKLDKHRLRIVSYDPNAAIDDLQKLYPHHHISTTLVTLTDFRRLWSLLDLCLQGEVKHLQAMQQSVSNDAGATTETSKPPRIEAHLVSLLDSILLDAASERASDIHLEQYDGNLRVRLRIDGELRDLPHYQLSHAEILGLINVIKIRADLNIAEKRVPQGGRSRMVIGGTRYDLRIQVQPSLHGEYVVIRLLPQSGNLITIEELGLSPAIAARYQRLLDNPSGMVLVVGPTGSGKSTTLYAGLQTLAQDKGRKVITVEDPIEYNIHNVQQTQVKPEIGFHFSDAMRSFVRLDPDVILIGEIRDPETALEALRASQTGHIVLSTLHCNDATDAQQRLFDLNAHPNSIASELKAVIAQRLAKRICPSCREETTPDPTILHELFPEGAPAGFQAFHGRGCSLCHQRGTRGRVAVVEFMQVNDDIREAISRRASTLEVRAVALDSGLVSMRDSALEHVINGIIPMSELPKLLQSDRMAPEQRGPVAHLHAS